MSKKMKKYTALGMALVATSSLFVTTNAKNATETVKITYKNAKVKYNGEFVTPNAEPFLLNNSAYVSVRDIGQMTGNAVDWDSANSTVVITPKTNNSLTNEQTIELVNLRVQNNTLTQKVADLEKKLAAYEGDGNISSITDSQISTTLSDIKKKYDGEYNVDWTFGLSRSGSKLVLDVSFRSSRSGTAFDKLTNTKLQGFLEDICFDINKALGNYEIQGELYDSSEKTTLGTYTYTPAKKFTYTTKTSTSSSSLSSFATTLERSYSKLAPKVFSGDDTIAVKSIIIETRSKTSPDLDFTLDIDAAYKTIWNTFYDRDSYSDEKNLESFLDDIAWDIEKKFDVDSVDGYILMGNRYVGKYVDGSLALFAY